jgi:two-component system, NarL family, sensor histidine kinase BarA
MVSRAAHDLLDPLGSPVSLAQLLDAHGVEDILGSFYALFRIPVRILDEDGVSVARSRKPSPLNEYLGQLPAARRQLGDAHLHLRNHDPGDSGEFAHTAFTGASYHVAMIGHEGRRVGRFILGPFITPAVRDVPPALVEADAQLDLGRVRQLLLGLPRVREDTVKAIARHLAVTLEVLIFAGHRALLSEYMHLSTVQENQRQLIARDEGLLAAEQRLAQQSRVQAAFLSSALGELRAPLESIMGQSEALASGQGDGSPRELVLAIRKRAAELIGLSSRLLDFSRADSGALALEREPIDIEALVERVAGKLSAMAPERPRGVSVACEAGLPRISGDAACLEQVLMLLGENALRFGSDGEISIEVRRAAPAESDDADAMVLFGGPPDRIELRVSDSGGGIPDAEKERVFEPFYRASRIVDGTARASGSGLGLAIVRRLIAAYGGNVRVVDNVPRGASLVVVLAASGPPDVA